MDFTFSEDQEQLRTSIRRFLGHYSSEADVRRLMDTDEGYDPSVWSRMANELGLQGLVIPEEYGGSGASWMELGIVLEEMGRSLLCAPFFSTVVLAATAVLESGDARAMRDVLPRIADGSVIVTLALTEESGIWEERGIELSASQGVDGYVLNGRKSYVLDGLIAEIVIVPARTPEGVTLFLVRGDATGLTRSPLKSLDLTRKLAALNFADVPAEVLGAAGSGWETVERTLDLAAVGLAAEQVGVAQAALDMAVEYAKERIQFGQAIGSFQAIKHKCVDVLVDVESARSAAYYALGAASQRSEELSASAALAKAFCSDASVLATHENIQIHGGIGFTWELAAHLYYKRAKSMELYLGDPFYHRERLIQHINAANIGRSEVESDA
jgi:alkylation response protein AidB-like acyl-CoA dehydrogenase